MFYELHVLAKKGALATVWIAAHLEKRLKRQHIVNTDLQQSIGKSLSPLITLDFP